MIWGNKSEGLRSEVMCWGPLPRADCKLSYPSRCYYRPGNVLFSEGLEGSSVSNANRQIHTIQSLIEWRNVSIRWWTRLACGSCFSFWDLTEFAASHADLMYEESLWLPGDLVLDKRDSVRTENRWRTLLLQRFGYTGQNPAFSPTSCRLMPFSGCRCFQRGSSRVRRINSLLSAVRDIK